MTEIDRISVRSRPEGLPIMRQNWGCLLFMHWPLAPGLLRRLVPSELSIDTFNGSAWIGIVPFTMWGIRASFLPPIPGTSAFHELNVRTYVHFKGVPGVWFFSLDAANRLAVWGARTFYHLPYFNAEMNLDQSADVIRYSSKRRDPMTYAKFFENESASFSSDREKSGSDKPSAAELNIDWQVKEPLPRTTPSSLGFFLTERYCLYSVRRNRVYRARIFHQPWKLQAAQINHCESTMIESLGLPAPQSDPILNYAESIKVEIWPLRKA